MKSQMMKVVALGVATTLLNTGCMLSRVVDRAFLGITVQRPNYADRKTTGIFLLPFTFAIDVVTFPIQALLVVILGDNFPFTDPPNSLQQLYALEQHPQFQRLGEAEQAVARAELQQLIEQGKLTPSTALGLGEDGHWTLVELNAEARSQLIARAQQPDAPAQLVCAR
jgi:hypothetical protein